MRKANPVLVSDNTTPEVCPAGRKRCSLDLCRSSVEFKKMELKAGDVLSEEKNKLNKILFLVRGEVSVKIDEQEKQYVNSEEMIFIAKDKALKITVVRDAQLYMLCSNNRIVFCSNDIVKTLANYKSLIDEHSSVMSITPVVADFLRSLQISTCIGINKPCYYIIKEYELAMILWYSYGVRQLKSFFKEALSPSEDFEIFVIATYKMAPSMVELANVANMSLSTFRRKFEAVFGETYQSWKVKQKSKDIVDAIKNGVTSNIELMELFEFPSYLVFYRFCVKNLKANPTKLREMYADKE